MEEMIAASAEVRQEQANSNYDLAVKINTTRYLPARDKLVHAFRLAIREVVLSEINKTTSSKKWGVL